MKSRRSSRWSSQACASFSGLRKTSDGRRVASLAAPGSLVAARGRQHARDAAQQPLVADRDQPADQERPRPQPGEDGGPRVGAGAIGQLVHEIDHNQRFALAATDLEDPLHHLAPDEEQCALLVRQLRVLGHEVLDHSAAVGQAVLEDEIIEEVDEVPLVDPSPPAEPPLERLAKRTGEGKQLTLQIAAPADEICISRHYFTPDSLSSPHALPYRGGALLTSSEPIRDRWMWRAQPFTVSPPRCLRRTGAARPRGSASYALAGSIARDAR